MRTQDVAAAPGDPRGVVLQLVIFACAGSGLAFAGLGSPLSRHAPVHVRMNVPLVLSLAVGAGIALVADPAAGAVPGDYLGLAGGLTLMKLAVTSVASGLAGLIGPPASA